MDAPRRAILERCLSFDEIINRLLVDAVVEVPTISDAWNKAPENTVRATFKVAVDRDAADLLYNGRSGLRARYWASPQLGDAATAAVIRSVRERLLAQVPAVALQSPRGIEIAARKS
jgi:hypothetical protein